MNPSSPSPFSPPTSAPFSPVAPPVGPVGPMPDSPWGAPARPPRPFPVEERPLAKKPRGSFPGLYARIFGIVVVVVTVAILALTTVAPAFSNHADSALPAGWTKVYDDVPNGSRDWSFKNGCSVTPRGLDVRGDRVEGGCAFVPSTQADLLSQGFLLDVTLAPDASIEGYQVPIVELTGKSGAIFVLFDQAGEYIICTNACARTSELLADDLSSAWHTDGYTPNHFTIRYLPAGGDVSAARLTVYTNGQEVRTVEGISLADAPALGLSAASAGPDDTFGEALYTHVTLYSASPPAS